MVYPQTQINKKISIMTFKSMQYKICTHFAYLYLLLKPYRKELKIIICKVNLIFTLGGLEDVTQELLACKITKLNTPNIHLPIRHSIINRKKV